MTSLTFRWVAIIQLPGRDQPVDGLDHQHLLLEQGDLLARVDCKSSITACEQNQAFR